MEKINGYIAAPFTPLHPDGSLNLDLVPAYADLLARNHLDGVFLCGSSGEGGLFSREERMQVVEKWIKVAGGKLKIIVHVGGTNIIDQQALASHAQDNGAYAISAMAPMFLGPKRWKNWVRFVKQSPVLRRSCPSIIIIYLD